MSAVELEAEAVGKIDIRIEHDHFVAFFAQENGIRNLAPARVPLLKLLNVDVLRKSIARECLEF